jgi:hypothetical protein
MNAAPAHPERESGSAPDAGPEVDPEGDSGSPSREADSPEPQAESAKPPAVRRNLDPEDWAGSSGSGEQWLLRERPPHW